MQKTRNNFGVFLAIAVVVVIVIGYCVPDWIVGGPPLLNAMPDNTVAACSGPGEFVRGNDKETGEVICGKVTGCPYGDSIPLDSPKCTAPVAPVYNAIEPVEYVSEENVSYGK